MDGFRLFIIVVISVVFPVMFIIICAVSIARRRRRNQAIYSTPVVITSHNQPVNHSVQFQSNPAPYPQVTHMPMPYQSTNSQFDQSIHSLHTQQQHNFHHPLPYPSAPIIPHSDHSQFTGGQQTDHGINYSDPNSNVGRY